MVSFMGSGVVNKLARHIVDPRGQSTLVYEFESGLHLEKLAGVIRDSPAGTFIRVNPLSFGEGMHLPNVGLVVIETQCEISLRYDGSGVLVTKALRQVTPNQLAVQYEFARAGHGT